MGSGPVKPEAAEPVGCCQKKKQVDKPLFEDFGLTGNIKTTNRRDNTLVNRFLDSWAYRGRRGRKLCPKMKI